MQFKCKKKYLISTFIWTFFKTLVRKSRNFQTFKSNDKLGNLLVTFLDKPDQPVT